MTFFEELSAIYGRLAFRAHSDLQRVGYATRLQQLTLFQVLTQVGGRDGRSILEAGCGWGAFYGYLRACGLDVRYTGVEIIPELLNEARERFPEADFRIGDILEADLPCYDFVTASGLFDYAVTGMRERMRVTLRRMFDLCRCGLAWNKFLPSVCTQPEHYGEPLEDLLSICSAITPWVIMRRDYDPGNVTFFLYKTAAFESPGMQLLAGRLWLGREDRGRLEEEPEAVMAEYQLSAQQLNLILSIVEAR